MLCFHREAQLFKVQGKNQDCVVFEQKAKLKYGRKGLCLFVLWEGAYLMLRMGRLLKVWGWGLASFGGGAKVI